MQQMEVEMQQQQPEEIAFVFCLYDDLLFEVLRSGKRRRLTRLEVFGRRFHHLIDGIFGEKPFLRLDLELLFVYNFCSSANLTRISNNV